MIGHFRSLFPAPAKPEQNPLPPPSTEMMTAHDNSILGARLQYHQEGSFDPPPVPKRCCASCAYCTWRGAHASCLAAQAEAAAAGFQRLLHIQLLEPYSARVPPCISHMDWAEAVARRQQIVLNHLRAIVSRRRRLCCAIMSCGCGMCVNHSPTARHCPSSYGREHGTCAAANIKTKLSVD